MSASARAACTTLIGPRGLAPKEMNSVSSVRPTDSGLRVAAASATA